MGRILAMSEKELNRYNVIQKNQQGTVKQKEAAKLLNISERHYRRLLKAYRREGASALVSKLRGRRSNRSISQDIRKKAIALMQSRYKGFGPTFVQEKLLEEEEIKLSNETVRLWMLEEGLWKRKRRKKLTVHQSRQRRERVGELIQMDGSPHRWFSERRRKCCLLAFIDDATSRIMHLRFVEAESTASYFIALREYIQKHGCPECFYSDRSSIFRISKGEDGIHTKGLTQVSRALKDLNIELICANSPQAKGRVERLFKTLQDRLVKELDLRGISTLEEANHYLLDYMRWHNEKFSIPPNDEADAHRDIEEHEDLDKIFCYQSERKLTKNFELSYEGRILQILKEHHTWELKGKKVSVYETLDGVVYLEYMGGRLAYKELWVRDHQGRILSRKNLSGGKMPRGGVVA